MNGVGSYYNLLNSMLVNVNGLLSPAQFTAVMTAVCSMLYSKVTLQDVEYTLFETG